MRRSVPILMAALLIGATTSCDNEDGLTAPEGEAVVQGRIESTTAAAAPGGGAFAASAGAQEVSGVVVARVSGSGDAQTVAEGTVDGLEYTVTGVPAGISPLVVIALGAEGDELGRVLVHGELTADEVVVAAPMNAETTLEAMVVASLLENDDDAAAANTGALVAFIHTGEAEATALLSAPAQVSLMAQAYQDAQAAISTTLAQAGLELDGEAQAELTTPVARQYAAQRDGGASLELAHDALVEALLGAYADAGVSGADLVVATAAATTAAIHPAEDFDEEGTRVAIARQALSINLRARQRLASATAGGSSTASALAAARVDLSGASTMAGIEAEMDEAATVGLAAVSTRVLDLVSELALSVRVGVEVALEAAVEEADLSAKLQGMSTSQSMAGVVAEYHTDVDAATEAVNGEIPAEVDFDAEATTNLLIAAGGSAWVE